MRCWIVQKKTKDRDSSTSPCKREEEIRQEEHDKTLEIVLAKMAFYNLLNLEFPYKDNPHFDGWACDCVVHGRRINARPTVLPGETGCNPHVRKERR